MSRTTRTSILYFAFVVTLVSGLCLVWQTLQTGLLEQPPRAKALEILTAAGFAVTAAVRRHFTGIDASGTPTSDQIASLSVSSLSQTCQELGLAITTRFRSLANSGVAYSGTMKAWKGVLAATAGGGVLLTLLTSTGLLALLGIGLAAPGVIDAGLDVVGEATKRWDHWEEERDLLRADWRTFESSCR
ncbi:MAG: hypothetical protein MUO38_14630 [Anaerolineales bacterium]|nr:hypothetical protein [Anaerolineales bacterium]